MSKRKDNQKQKFLRELETMPIIQVACERVGIPRSTYYRWKSENPEFSSTVEDALSRGKGCVNDLALSKLLQAIGSGDKWAIQYWLSHLNKDFMKLEKKLPPKKEDPLTITELMVMAKERRERERTNYR